MLRKLHRSTPSYAHPQATSQPARKPPKKPSHPQLGTDSCDGPPPLASPPMPSNGDVAAMQALMALLHNHPNDLATTDYQRYQRIQAALDACVPWLASVKPEHLRGIDGLLEETQHVALSPETAGLFATVLHAASLIAAATPRRFFGGRHGNQDASCYTHLVTQLRKHAGMAPYLRILDTVFDATQAVAQQGKAAMHGCMFDCYMGLLDHAEPKLSWEEIAFIQQALVVLGTINLDAVYKVRAIRPLADVLLPLPAARIAGPDADWLGHAHHRIRNFINLQGGLGLGPRLCWTLGEALTAAAREPHMLHTLFALEPWPLRPVRDPTPKHATPPRIDLQSHLMGTMYHAVLHHINGNKGSGWRRRDARAPIDVKSQRDFLGHVLSELHHAVVGMPTGWIPVQQLQELHQVAMDGIAQDCDPFTLRARLQGYASTAAASPKLGELEEAEAHHIAEGWEAFKSRLYTDEMPLSPP